MFFFGIHTGLTDMLTLNVVSGLAELSTKISAVTSHGKKADRMPNVGTFPMY
jgi:hypothetical protein